MLWPALKHGDGVYGIDVHAVIVPPAVVPAPLPHPYFGPIYLWHTPQFPITKVFINGMPAVTVGSMGYFAHFPLGVPSPTTVPNIPYWRRYILNLLKVGGLTLLTMVANTAIAGISAMIPNKPPEVSNFIKDVTGIDPTDGVSTWKSVQENLRNLTKWSTWGPLLMPPAPYIGAQGSVAIGSPNVQVNGAPLAFVAPFVATSCSDIPVVPNAETLGFSNVMVGVTMEQLAHAIAVNMVQGAIREGIGRATQGRKDCGCG